MLLAPELAPAASGTAGAVGTSGTTPAIDPAVRAKLVQFREHLKQFEAVALAATPAPAAAPAAAADRAATGGASSTPPATASTTSTSTTTTTTTAAPPETRPDPEPRG